MSSAHINQDSERFSASKREINMSKIRESRSTQNTLEASAETQISTTQVVPLSMSNANDQGKIFAPIDIRGRVRTLKESYPFDIITSYMLIRIGYVVLRIFCTAKSIVTSDLLWLQHNFQGTYDSTAYRQGRVSLHLLATQS
jgi:hypothetical protein